MIEVAVAFCLAGAANGQPPEVVDAFVAAYNARDIGALRRVVSADARFGNAGRSVSGETAITNYETTVFVQYPDVRLETRERLAVGDLVAQTELLTGIGEPEVGLSVYRVTDGCIVEMSINQ